MNKQEQIEKMAKNMSHKESICRQSDCNKCSYAKRFCPLKHNAKVLVEAGYINGADFVEWLKKHPYFGMLCPNPEYEEALQEYLKGE